VIIAGAAVAFTLLAFAFYLYRVNTRLTGKYEDALKKKEDRLTEQLSEQKQKIEQALDEKYRADKVSYKAMSQRLEKEKDRKKEIEKELKKLRQEPPERSNP